MARAYNIMFFFLGEEEEEKYKYSVFFLKYPVSKIFKKCIIGSKVTALNRVDCKGGFCLGKLAYCA